MGYDHLRIKSNAKAFYHNNSGWSMAVVVMGVFFGTICAIVARFIPFIGGMLVTPVSMLLGPVVMMGMLGWFRRTIYKPESPTAMFNVFSENYWGKLGTMLLMSLYVFLWSMLFVIPGYIKAYEYSMVPYIKEENPNMPAEKCFQLSRVMTYGHKADLFYLDLSFLGWHTLAALTLCIVGILYAYPYYFSARAFAYEELKAEAISLGKISPMEFPQNMSNPEPQQTYGQTYGQTPEQMSETQQGKPSINLNKEDR